MKDFLPVTKVISPEVTNLKKDSLEIGNLVGRKTIKSDSSFINPSLKKIALAGAALGLTTGVSGRFHENFLIGQIV